MKIGVYLGDISPHMGGNFTFQEDIVQALLELQDSGGHSFVIYSNLKDHPDAARCGQHLQFERTHNHRLRKMQMWLRVSFNGFGSFFRSLHLRGWFERSLRKHSVELVWFVTPAHYLVDVPYVFTVLDLHHRVQPWFPEVSSYGKWEFREKSYAQVIGRAVAVIAPNNAGKDEVLRFYSIFPERVRTIPHPTPSFALNAPPDDCRGVLEKYNLPENFVFYPAQFWPHKNHVTLLAALRLLKQRENLLLPAVFTGADQGNLEHVKSLIERWDMQSQVRILGFVTRQDLIGLYRNALALTYVTFFGPENLPPLEAFALGCPVIASRVSGASEQLRDAALLVDPANPEDLAAAMWSVYQDGQLRECLIQRGKQRAREWTAKDYVRESLRLFDEFEPMRRCWPAVV